MSRQLGTLLAVAAFGAGALGVAEAQPSTPGAVDDRPHDAPDPADDRPHDAPDDPVAPPPATTPAPAAPASGEPEIGDQEISVEAGIAAGSRVTPGGLRIGGHFLYQLSERDWFDTGVAFTFGSGTPACFRDREDQLICDHGALDGTGVVVSGAIRRMLALHESIRPFARIGIGIGFVRYGDDGVSGLSVTARGGAGIRIKAAAAISFVAQGELELGFGTFGENLGTEPQLGLAVTAGAEFRLR